MLIFVVAVNLRPKLHSHDAVDPMPSGRAFLREGAKFWLKVVNELKARGVNDNLIAVVDGLKGFPEAITSVFPQTIVQTCIVHLIRNSLAFVSWKDRNGILLDSRMSQPELRRSPPSTQPVSPLSDPGAALPPSYRCRISVGMVSAASAARWRST